MPGEGPRSKYEGLVDSVFIIWSSSFSGSIGTFILSLAGCIVTARLSMMHSLLRLGRSSCYKSSPYHMSDVNRKIIYLRSSLQRGLRRSVMGFIGVEVRPQQDSAANSRQPLSLYYLWLSTPGLDGLHSFKSLLMPPQFFAGINKCLSLR